MPRTRKLVVLSVLVGTVVAIAASFRAPPAALEQWLLDSPGTREAQPVRLKTGGRKYAIRPGGGASGAEVTVVGSDTVYIYVYWS